MTQTAEPTDETSEPGSNHLDAEQAGYHQTLSSRHVQMIAIGGAIGTGLFLGSASRLASTGPALIISYAVVGVIAYFLMRALGELVLHRATSGAFVSYMREFFGEAWAFATGWIYWGNWALTGIAELSAVGLYMQYWFPTLDTWITVLVSLVVVLSINLLSARAFGEFEFWAAILKVGAIVLFLVVGTVVVILGLNIGGHEAGIHNLWSNPGGFWPSKGDFHWYGPILVMSGVVFAYAAIEMVGVAAGEMANAKKEVPKAVNAVIFRIAVFYIGSIFLLCCLLPTSEYKAGTSPFVTVFEQLGFTWMSAVIQAILIVAAMSSLNSGLYSTGRVLRSLGMSDQAPKFTLRMSKSGVPYAGILMTSIVFIFGSVLNAFTPDAFEIAVEATSVMILFTWATIFACQIRLRQLTDRGIIPASSFQAPGSPWTSIVGLVFLVLVLVGLAVSGWHASPELLHKTSFLVVVFGIPVLALALVIGWRAVKPKVMENTQGRIKAVWSLDGPTYGPDVTPDDLDVEKHEDTTQYPH